MEAHARIVQISTMCVIPKLYIYFTTDFSLFVIIENMAHLLCTSCNKNQRYALAREQKNLKVLVFPPGTLVYKLYSSEHVIIAWKQKGLYPLKTVTKFFGFATCKFNVLLITIKNSIF